MAWKGPTSAEIHMLRPYYGDYEGATGFVRRPIAFTPLVNAGLAVRRPSERARHTIKVTIEEGTMQAVSALCQAEDGDFKPVLQADGRLAKPVHRRFILGEEVQWPLVELFVPSKPPVSYTFYFHLRFIAKPLSDNTADATQNINLKRSLSPLLERSKPLEDPDLRCRSPATEHPCPKTPVEDFTLDGSAIRASTARENTEGQRLVFAPAAASSSPGDSSSGHAA